MKGRNKVNKKVQSKACVERGELTKMTKATKTT